MGPTTAAAERAQPAELKHNFADLKDARLHYVEQGEGPMVLLLHGFPEFWYSWHLLIPVLAQAGYRVVAPDQRGYNTSSKPRGIRPYRVERMIDDAAELIAHLGAERAHVVGHDWGGGVAWYLAMQRPELVDKLVIIDSPHPERFASSIFRFPQVLKSWYMFAMLLPFLPELIFSAFRGWVPRKMITSATLRKGAHTAEDLERYTEAWTQKGVWNRTVNWYRALLWRGPKGVAYLLKVVSAPTLILWGMKDVALGHAMAEPKAELVPNASVHKLPRAGHFAHIDEPDEVAKRIIDFLR